MITRDGILMQFDAVGQLATRPKHEKLLHQSAIISRYRNHSRNQFEAQSSCSHFPLADGKLLAVAKQRLKHDRKTSHPAIHLVTMPY